jgi:solute carrier family 25 uncoupling protein 8/9
MSKDDRTGRVLKEMAAGSIGMATASSCLNSLDVVKVRIQLSGTRYTGMFDCASKSIEAAGGVFRGLMLPGLTATVLRDVLNGAFRVGLYKEIERYLFPVGSVTPILLQKVVTGTLVGATGAGLWSHTDLVKTRLQTQSVSLPAYSSTWNAYSSIYKEAGLRGLYQGVGPNMLRAGLITTFHVGAYDLSKRNISKYMGESPLVWTLCGLASALVTTTVAAPVDLVRTRVMTGESSKGVLKNIFMKEGARGFFKGWTASFSRFGPHFTISWPLIEAVRKHVFNLDSFYVSNMLCMFILLSGEWTSRAC